MQNAFAEVALFSPPYEELTYRVPLSLKDRIQTGDAVRVPLNRREVGGLVVEFHDNPSIPNPKEIIEPVFFAPRLDPSLIRLCRWAADYYLSKPGMVLCAAVPPPILMGRRTLWACPSEKEEEAASNIEAEILCAVRSKGRVSTQSLTKKFHGKERQAIDRLLEKGLVRFDPCPERKEERGDTRSIPTLNREQTEAVAAISESIQRHEFRSFLLYGVTGSGKTEVYLHAIDQVQKKGLGTLVMVPEIGLTPQLTDRIKRRFGSHVAVLHSGLAQRDRLLQWENIHSGKSNIVVGARSSVFAPLKSIGLIVVDEEHDSSYKQEEGFRYNGRDLAIVRARIARCPIILGSATPAMESYHNALSGRYRLLSLKERIEKRPPPAIEWVDLRKHFAKRSSSLLSSELTDSLTENWLKGRQSLLFLNRRGFAEYLLCTLCGFVFMCPNCSVTLTFHRETAEARCHYCNLSAIAPDTCPKCGSARLKGVGSGTEKVQSELKKLLPHARIGRMDRDTVKRKGAYESILSDWGTAKIDVLVGTQIVTKGHDIPGVTLVGVLLADSSLNRPDFRAAEKTFQLVTQVAGRAGRGDEKGRVIVQTFQPDHYVFESVRKGDMQRFFDQEIQLRRSLGYPPFTRLAEIRLDGAVEANVRSAALRVGSRLRDILTLQPHSGAVELIGPAPAPISRIRNRFRWHLLLKGKDPQSLRRAIIEAKHILFPRTGSQRIRISVDVDPIDML